MLSLSPNCQPIRYMHAIRVSRTFPIHSNEKIVSLTDLLANIRIMAENISENAIPVIAFWKKACLIMMLAQMFIATWKAFEPNY